MVVISKLYTKMYNFNEIRYEYLINTVFKLKNFFLAFISLNIHTKRA